MTKNRYVKLVLVCLVLALGQGAVAEKSALDPNKDLISLHYDHAPDRDDGHSAAADRTILQALYDVDWIKEHVLAVSGAYGKNANRFRPKSDKVMDAVWDECGGWISARDDRNAAIGRIKKRWAGVIESGGDIWVKEGGQSDITAEVAELIGSEMPDVDPRDRIHVIQHSKWNENQTTDAALAYTKKHTDYQKIPDANSFLNIKGGNRSFIDAARAHPVFGRSWRAAFEYYNPNNRLDFSDTGELMYILGLGEFGIPEFKERFLKAGIAE